MMRLAGGIIALIAGIFGFLAALLTLFAGGLGAVFEADDADLVVLLGWGGVLFSFLVIVFGSIAIGVRRRWPGLMVAISSLLGAILGGTLVAIAMVLSLVGGLLSFFGGGRTKEPLLDNATIPKNSSQKLDTGETDLLPPAYVEQVPASKKPRTAMLMIGSIAAAVLATAVFYNFVQSSPQSENVAPSAVVDASPQSTEYHSLDHSVQINGFSLNIVDARISDTVGTEFFQRTASTDELFVLISYAYENNSSQPVPSYRTPRIALIDAAETKYSADLGASAAYATELQFDSNILSDINPGITKNDGAAFLLSRDQFDASAWKLVFQVGRETVFFDLAQISPETSEKLALRESEVSVSSASSQSSTKTPFVDNLAASPAETEPLGDTEEIITQGLSAFETYGISNNGWCCASVIGVEDWDRLNIRLAPDADSQIVSSFPHNQREIIVFECDGRLTRENFFEASERGNRASGTWCLVGENVEPQQQTRIGWVNAWFLRAISP